MIVVFREKQRRRWLSGLKPIYFYIIANIGQIIGFFIFFLPTLGYIPDNYYSRKMYCLFGFPYIEAGSQLAEGMLLLSALLAIPYLLLVSCKAFKLLIRKNT